MRTESRIFGLDLLRAFAVLCVVYGHGYNFFSQYIPQKYYNIPLFEGVTLFFVLSGFLIGRILLKTLTHEDFNGAMLREFWVRRWCRTLPNYFLVLIVLAICYPLLDKPLPDSLLRYFTFSQNLFSPHPAFFPEAWSLAVEEWFYLCIPLPIYFLSKFSGFDRRRLMLYLIIAVIIAVTAFRFYRAWEYGFTTMKEWDDTMRKQVFIRFDGLMLGVLGAYLSLYHEAFWERVATRATITGIVLFLADKVLAGFFELPAYINYLTILVSNIATLCLLPMLSHWRRAPDKMTASVTFISVISYSMYLLNLTPIQGVLLFAVERHCGGCSMQGPLIYAAYWVGTIGTSYLLYRLYESPMTSLRDRWRPSGTNARADRRDMKPTNQPRS
jgi:peptidoglycan/LPS O-acetylase OafA/YrhL